MALTIEDRERIEAFRTYIEDTVATDDRYGTPVREDTEPVLATRFHEGASCWFEVALLPATRQVRVGFFTTDPEINKDCEEVIAESGQPVTRFVGQAFEDAGLDWSNPSVDHGSLGPYYFATSLPYDETIDLDLDNLRDKTLRMLEGYLIAFGPALGVEEPD